MGTRFVLNRAGVGQLAQSSEMHSLMNDVMEAAKGAAQSIAPRDTGDYADSFEVEKNQTATIAGTRRAAATLRNTAPHAAAVEYGYAGDSETPGQSAHRVLRRAIELVAE